MGIKKNIFEIFSVKNLINTLINFIETKVEIYKIQFKEEAAKAISALILLVIFSMLGLLFVLFLSLFASEVINTLLDSNYIGYIIIAAFYLLCIYIIYLLRRKIKAAVIEFIFTDDLEETDSVVVNE